MPICNSCQQFTNIEDADPKTGDLFCQKCEKKIMENGRLVQSTPVDESLQKNWIPTICLILFAFMTGATITSVYKAKTARPPVIQEQASEDRTLEEDIINPPEIVVIPPVLETTIDILLAEGVFLGNTVSNMTIDNPDLFALSEEGNHFAVFENGLYFTIQKQVDVQNIFYFFDDNNQLKSVEYTLIPPKEIEISSFVEDIASQLTEEFRLLEETETYYLWEASDGFIGLHRTQLFLHITEKETTLMNIFS